MDNPEPYTATIHFEEDGIKGEDEAKEEDPVSKVDKSPNPTATSLNVQIPDNLQQNVFTLPTMEAPIYNTTLASTIPEEPVSQLLSRILSDPASLKLLTVIVSALAMCLVSLNTRGSKQGVPSFVITGTSLIYSLFSLFVTVIWKNQKKIEKCGIFKIFAGRIIFWHEIHSSMTLTLAFANLSCVVLTMWSPLLNVIFSLINAGTFGCEVYLATKNAATKYETIERVPKCQCFLGLFKRHSFKFNVLQLVFFIAAFVIYVCQAYQMQSYFMYCSIVTIIGSCIPFASLLFRKLGNSFGIDAWYFSNPKIKTYVSIGITIHAFLVVLTNSVDSQYTHRYYYYYYRDYDRYYESFITISPISFSISCVIFVLSLLDLYSQAIFNKSRPINESQNPLLVKSEQKYPFRNLPTTIENPLGIAGVKEVYGY
uniref:Transmembrane protein n=1 Tax=Panagrolaimus sp. ES5 TaxID=591445 RepID=A0AC34EZV8_9BILA